MRSEQIVRFKGSPFSKAGADNSRAGIVKEIVFRPRHDTNQMPDYIAVELLVGRTAASAEHRACGNDFISVILTQVSSA